MSDEDKQSGYIQAVLEQHGEKMVEISVKLDSLNAKIDSLAIARISDRAKIEILEDAFNRNKCPRAGLCVELEKKVEELKSDSAQYKSDKNAAYSVWKVIGTVGGICVGATATVWGVIEIIKSIFNKP
jgi:outer membrane murein-binding lipoprotein Lpp